MSGLPTISRGIGYGPLSTISRGYLGGLFEFAPGIALVILASPSTTQAIAAASVLLLQAQASATQVQPAPSVGTISPAPAAATVTATPSAIQ